MSLLRPREGLHHLGYPTYTDICWLKYTSIYLTNLRFRYNLQVLYLSGAKPIILYMLYYHSNHKKTWSDPLLPLYWVKYNFPYCLYGVIWSFKKSYRFRLCFCQSIQLPRTNVGTKWILSIPNQARAIRYQSGHISVARIFQWSENILNG